MKINAVGRTDVGTKRMVNEDSIYCPKDTFAWVVADGMGGHSAGDFASKTITETFEYYAQKTAPPQTLFSMAEFHLHCIDRANTSVRQHMKNANIGTIGSTVACVTINNGLGLLSWVGDSRLYRLRSGSLTCLSQDHSYVQELIKAQQISLEEAQLHPARNIITRAIGVEDSITADIQVFTPEVGDLYLICTDGLYNNFEHLEPAIVALDVNANLDAQADSLMATTLADGADDNVSFILLRVSA